MASPVHTDIRDLIQDDQMFRPDCDPTFFDPMRIEDNLNNNIGQNTIRDLEAIYSDSWSIPSNSDFEFFSELFDVEMAEKKEEPTSPPSPIPAPASPVIEEAVEVKSEDPSFDLINYIIFGQVRVKKSFEIEQFLTGNFFSLSPQNAELLTPVEEKPAPIFELPIVIKDEPTPEPEPSTSGTASPVQFETSTRRRAPKRRYSSDSDFSINTSASSYNATKQRSAQRKRGRPAKELITELPTVDDFADLPLEDASHLVLRIKNNEASRKSRMKSKSKQNAMEDECDRLLARKQRLNTKKNKLEAQIEVLRRWLLGQN